MITEAEMRAEAHVRAERGTRCFQSGRCRLPNSYLYDKEIIPRVKQAILVDGRFSDTSIWVQGRRGGCGSRAVFERGRRPTPPSGWCAAWTTSSR